MRWIALGAVVALLVMVVAGAAAETGPPAPTNLEVVAVTEDSVTIAWGPSMPGTFSAVSEPKKNQLLIQWEPSFDSRSAVTYTISKDGTQLASGLAQNQYVITGLSAKVTTFRTCVTAYNAAQQASPQNCATWTR